MAKKKRKTRQRRKTEQENKLSQSSLQAETRASQYKGIVLTVFAAVFFLVALAMGLWYLSGEGRNPEDTLAFRVGEQDVYMDEVHFCVLQNVVNLGISTSDLEGVKTQDGVPAAEYYKQELFDMITNYKMEYQIAQKQGMKLSEKDKEIARRDAIKYLSGINSRVLRELGISQDCVISVFEEQMLAKRLEDQVTADVSAEKQQFCTLYMMLFPKVEMDDSGTVKTEADGKTPQLLSQEDISKRKEDADAAYAALLEGAEVEAVAAQYGVEEYSGEERNLADSFGDPFSTYAKTLKEGEYSPVLETESCYAILKMITENNEELAEQVLSHYEADIKKESLESEREKWREELGIVDGPKDIREAWKKLSLFDFAQYVEE